MIAATGRRLTPELSGNTKPSEGLVLSAAASCSTANNNQHFIS